MGIKHYFGWFTKKYGGADILKNTNITDEFGPRIDVLGLDLNGLFHPVAQEVFKYGEHKRKKSFLYGNEIPVINKSLERQMGEKVSAKIDALVKHIKPAKTLILCVDGVAGAAKMSQQRQRRFKASLENDGTNGFDSNCISPGTMFMHNLTLYLRAYIKTRQKTWGVRVIFSDEKYPGEGEHTIIQFIKEYCDIADSVAIYGLDGDLFMLCLSLYQQRISCLFNQPKATLGDIYIVRNNVYDTNREYVINISRFGEALKRELQTDSAIIDFIFICFMVGNDFLPQISSLEIINGGIDRMLDVYKQHCRFGLIDYVTYEIRISTFLKYIRILSETEEDDLKFKFMNRKQYFEDPLLEAYFTENRDGIVECRDFGDYKRDYYDTKLNIRNISDLNKLGNEYIKGLQWVMLYYFTGMPNWKWFFPYHYGPFLSDLKNCKNYVYIPFPPSSPAHPFQQLLSVLPPQSIHLLPRPLRKIIIDDKSPVKKYYPLEFETDYTGKRAMWEAIVILPIIDYQLLEKVFKRFYKHINMADLERTVTSTPLILD